MRVTILPLAIILNNAHRAAVNIMAEGSIVACVLPLIPRCFLFILTNYMKSNSLHILTRGKYFNRNTPRLQYSPFSTFGG